MTVPAGVDVTTDTKELVTQMSGGKKSTFVERNFAADTLTFHLQRAATNNVTLAYFVIS